VSLPAGAGRSGQPGDRPDGAQDLRAEFPDHCPNCAGDRKVSDGVDVGVVLVVERPDLVVLQDLLPLLPGL